MRVIFVLTALIIVLGWLGFELRERQKDISQVLFGFAAVLLVFLVGAFFGFF